MNLKLYNPINKNKFPIKNFKQKDIFELLLIDILIILIKNERKNFFTIKIICKK